MVNNQYKTGADGGNILGQPMLFECIDICVLSPAHECEMRGSLAYLLIVKYLSIQPQYFILNGLIVDFFCWGWLKTFLEGSVDHTGII